MKSHGFRKSSTLGNCIEERLTSTKGPAEEAEVDKQKKTSQATDGANTLQSQFPRDRQPVEIQEPAVPEDTHQIVPVEEEAAETPKQKEEAERMHTH